MVLADFGFRANDADAPRWLDSARGAGARLEVGVYPVSLASMAFGEMPSQVAALGCLDPSGTDEQSGFLLRYEHGGLAVLSCAVRTKTPRHGAILGTEGMIRLAEPFYRSPAATLAIPGREELTESLRVEGNGYHYQARAMMDSFRRGERENDLMPLDESYQIMKVLDIIGNQLGDSSVRRGGGSARGSD